MFHPGSAGAAAEQPYGSSTSLTSVLSTCILTFRHFWSSKCLTFHHIIPLIQSTCKCHTIQYYSSVWMETQIQSKCYSGVFNLFFHSKCIKLQDIQVLRRKEGFVRFCSHIFCEQIVTSEHVPSQNTGLHQSSQQRIRNMNHIASRLEFVLNVSISSVFTSWLRLPEGLYPLWWSTIFPISKSKAGATQH